jgi:hypothetical protein
MNDLDDRLAAWNPVRAQDTLQAAASADAARLLHRILNQPADAPSRHPALRASRPTRAWIAATAAAAVTVVAIAAAVAGAGSQVKAPGGSAGHRITGFQRGPSLGVANSAIQLVDYSSRSAALAPVFVPGPHDWEYVETYFGRSLSGGPGGVGDSQTWQQVGTSSRADSWHHGKITYLTGGGPGAGLGGWPASDVTSIYQYLATLPSQPAALRKIILANNHGDPGAAFTAIENIFGNFPVSAQFQAELYAVLAGLPGVGFNPHAVDAAGRTGVGLYLVQPGSLDAGSAGGGYLEEVIVNPRSYAYMGGMSIWVQGHPSYAAVAAHPRPGAIAEYVAILNSGIVSQAGQLP